MAVYAFLRVHLIEMIHVSAKQLQNSEFSGTFHSICPVSFLIEWIGFDDQINRRALIWWPELFNGVACLRCCICTLTQLKHLYCLFPPGAFCAFLLLFSRVRFSLNLAIGDDTKIVYLNYKIKQAFLNNKSVLEINQTHFIIVIISFLTCHSQDINTMEW